jgi:hypothetical protein
MELKTYRTLLVSGALATLALGATMIAQGDWQPPFAAVGWLSGGIFLMSLTRLLAMADRGPWPRPRLPNAPCVRAGRAPT